MFNAEHSKVDPEYSVVEEKGCTIIYGSIPLSIAASIFKSVPKGSIMDFTLARMLGANIALGLPEDTEAYRHKIAPAVIAKISETYRNFGLSDEAIQWLAVGEQGNSSKAMFHHITGATPSPNEINAHPRDVDDLRRCIELEERVPEITGNIGKMAKVSDTWNNLADNWASLKGLFAAGKYDVLYQRMREMGC